VGSVGTSGAEIGNNKETVSIEHCNLAEGSLQEANTKGGQKWNKRGSMVMDPPKNALSPNPMNEREKKKQGKIIKGPRGMELGFDERLRSA